MSAIKTCTALMVSSIASGQGKTTITAALAAYFTRQGQRVRVFKCGPDFIDPTILQRASGHPVYQLDLWMVGESSCRQLLAQAAQSADVILIEGVMGLFDGTPSTADLARAFDLPVLVVLDGSAMAQTFGAVVHGLVHHDTSIVISGVIANRVNHAGHSALLQQSIRDPIHYGGYLPRDSAIHLPERHLGLQLAHEIKNIDSQLERAAQLVEQHLSIRLDAFLFSAEIKSESALQPNLGLQGVRIGIARDHAFCFLYQANVDALQDWGAELIFFSPCTDELPDVDSVYFPGGYPELFSEQLSKNQTLKQQIKQHYMQDKPILAECGGLMLLAHTLVDFEQQQHAMVGLIDIACHMQQHITAIGLQQGCFNGEYLRGHTFHYSSLKFLSSSEKDGISINRHQAQNPSGHAGEWIFQQRRLTASYVHWYFPSNPAAAISLLRL